MTNRQLRRGALALAFALCALPYGAARAVEQTAWGKGVFFEAEDYDGRIRGPASFGRILDEPLASGQQAIMGMWQDGLISYGIDLPEAGKYTIWLRGASPSNTQMRLGFDTIDPAKLLAARVAQTREKLDAAGAYQWRKLAQVELKQGSHAFIVGQGALRPDCFFFTRDAEFVPTDELLEKLQAVREAPKGVKLPELVHERRITQHPKWLKHALRPCYAHFEWDKGMTAEAWCKRAAAAGANCIIGAGEMPAGAVDGRLRPFSYKNLQRNPDFKLPDDYDLSYQWVKEFADAAHGQGLKIAIYGGAFRTLDPLLVEHPEWRQMDVRGRPYPNGFGSWHSPYRKAYIERWVRVAKLARFDGIMIDMLFTGPYGGDYSQWTVKAFKDRFGVAPPREPDPRNLTWQRWIDFQSWTREEMLLDLTEALHAVDPEIAVIINQTEGWIFRHGESNFLTSRVAQCVDGLLEEMGWDYRHTWDRPWAWPVNSAWQNLFLRCRTRPGYGQMWHVTLNFPEVHAQCLEYSMLANGVAPAVVAGGNWPEMTRMWAHIKGCEPWIEENELVPWMAIHWGEDTLQWYANAQGDDVYMAHMKNVFGFFQAALEMHLPIEIITDDDLADAAKLKRYATVLLPNSACLSDAQAAAISQYVEQGGGLVASYETGRYDEDGVTRETPALEPLFGVAQYGPVQSRSWSIPLHDVKHPIMDHPDIQTAGAWRQGFSVRAKNGVLYSGPRQRNVGAVATSTPPAGAAAVPLMGAGKQRPAGAPEVVRYKALIARQHGQGKVVYFPIDMGHAYYVFNHPLNRRLITRAIEWTAAYPNPLRTNALMKVQTVLYRKGGARVVHLVNDISSFGRAAAPNPEAFTAFRSEVAPVFDIKVAVEGVYKSALLLPLGKSLKVRETDGFTEAIVPRIDVHGVVVFRP